MTAHAKEASTATPMTALMASQTVPREPEKFSARLPANAIEVGSQSAAPSKAA